MFSKNSVNYFNLLAAVGGWQNTVVSAQYLHSALAEQFFNICKIWSWINCPDVYTESKKAINGVNNDVTVCNRNGSLCK